MCVTTLKPSNRVLKGIIYTIVPVLKSELQLKTVLLYRQIELKVGQIGFKLGAVLTNWVQSFKVYECTSTKNYCSSL